MELSADSGLAKGTECSRKYFVPGLNYFTHVFLGGEKRELTWWNEKTFLEVIKARYGTSAHLVFTVFGLMTNILVTAMLLTGGSAAVSAMTGMSTPAACFLLPIGVVIYTMFGGIKATFLTVSFRPRMVTTISS